MRCRAGKVKIDEPLITRVQALKEVPLRADEARLDRLERIKVLLHFTGGLGTVEEAGFWTEFQTERIAVGTIAAVDLERVAELDNVVSIQSNRPSRLTKSVGAADEH